MSNSVLISWTIDIRLSGIRANIIGLVIIIIINTKIILVKAFLEVPPLVCIFESFIKSGLA